MKDKEFIQSILDKIGEFGDGELEFETTDVERLCNIALKAVKNNAVLPHVSVSVAKILKPKYANTVFTWKQIKDAIELATER